MKKEQKIYRGTCVNCPQTEDRLPLSEVLYYGFGGYSVKQNGKVIYEGDPQGEWDSFLTLRQVEKKFASKYPKSRWTVELNNPLRGAVWLRKEKNKWLLISTNKGFA